MHLADAFTAAAVLAGLWAALLRWRSGHVEMDGKDTPSADIMDPKRRGAFNDAVDRMRMLNSHAAIWIAVFVAAQALATVLGRLAVSG